MSYFTYQKRKTTIKSILVMLGLTIGAIALMASPAYADPEKKVEEQTEQVEETAKEEMVTPTDPMELPETAIPQSDGVADAPIEIDPATTPSKTVPETVPEIATEDPAVKNPTEFSSPISGKDTPVLDTAQSCHKQETGAYECICESDKDCSALTSSDICEPGTEWRNAEGFGGCTKKAE